MDRFARQTASRAYSPEDPQTADLPAATHFDEDTAELDPPPTEPALAREPPKPAPEEPTQVSVTVQVHRAGGAAAPAVHLSTPAPATSQPAVEESPKAAPAAASPPPKFVVTGFRDGETIRARYLLEEQIGSGGSSIVFRARDLRRDPMLDRDAYIALKVPREPLRERRDIADRLKREFQQTQALAHPNIVRVFDIDCEQSTWFMTMELLDGESLSTLLACLHPQLLPQGEAFSILRGCGEALAFAHDRGVLHCDFKPGNVFVTHREDVRVLDFGVAGVAAKEGEQGGQVLRVSAATPCYASPDILEGTPPDERDDVFSFACVAYEILTGRHPFERHSTLEARDMGMRVRRLPGLDRQQYRALQRALSWSRKSRYGSIREFLFAMGVFQARASSLGWLKAGAAVAAGAVLAAIAYNFYWESDRERDVQAAKAVHWAAASPAEIRARQAAEQQKQQTATVPSPVGVADASTAQPVEASSKPAKVASAAAIPSRPNTLQAHPLDAAPLAAMSPESRTPAQSSPQAVPSLQAASAAGPPAIATNRISLEQPRIVVSESAVSAVVRARRLDDLTGRVRIQWRAIPGGAQPGLDYSMDGIGTIDIPEGQDVRVLFIPILNDKVRESNESFDVELFGLAGSGSLEPITRATVTILDND